MNIQQSTNNSLLTEIPEERIAQMIYCIRDQKVILDSDLAEMYGLETKLLKRAVRRNPDRFPEDFMFELLPEEWNDLRCNSGTSRGWGGARYLPYVFTEQGVAMLSSVLHTPQAISVNIAIMRAFVRIRQWTLHYSELAEKIAGLESQLGHHSQIITEILKIIDEMIHPQMPPRNPIGYKTTPNSETRT